VTNYTGTSGPDNYPGSSGIDTFDMSQGGDDTVSGQGSADTFNFGAAFTAADTIDGGTGNDTLALNGDYSAGYTLGATTLTSVETITVAASHAYRFTTNNANVASGATLNVTESGVFSSGGLLTFNGAAETDGYFNFTITGGKAVLTGGAQADVFTMGASLDALDVINGTGGDDFLFLDGDYSAGVTFTSSTIKNIKYFELTGGHDYKFTSASGNIAASAMMFVDGAGLGVNDDLTFDGSAEVVGKFDFNGGLGKAILKGGALDDIFEFGSTFNPANELDGGGGDDNTLYLSGDNSAAVTFTASTIKNIARIYTGNGDVNFTSNDANVASGATLTIDAGDSLTDSIRFIGAAETDGSFTFIGGGGVNIFTGGAKDDFFTYSANKLDSADTLNGGAGNDTLTLSGDYASGLSLANVLSVETLTLTSGNSYTLTGPNVAFGSSMTLQASGLGIGSDVQFDGSGETDGQFNFYAGGGSNNLIGGGSVDTFYFLSNIFNANDSVDGMGGSDRLYLTGAAEIDLSSSNFKRIENINYTNLVTTGNLVLGAGTIDAGQSLTVDASALTGSFTFSALNLTTGTLTVKASSGVNTLMGSQSDTIFDFRFRGLTLNDHLTGSGVSDTTLMLGDNYSAGFTFGSATIVDITEIDLGVPGGANYKLTMNDANVDADDFIIIDATALLSSNTVNIDASAETDGLYAIKSGEAIVNLRGGAGNDEFYATAYNTADEWHGGGGTANFVRFEDSITATFGASTLTDIQQIVFGSGTTFNIVTNDTNVASGERLNVSASLISSGTVTFDGSAETDGGFDFVVGGGTMNLKGGAGDDTFSFQNGDRLLSTDELDGGPGGSDVVTLFGDYSAGLTLLDQTLQNISKVELYSFFSSGYALTFADGNIGAGRTLTLDATNAGSVPITIVDSAETTGTFRYIGGGGTQTVTTGAGNDQFIFSDSPFTSSVSLNGGGGNDTLTLTGNYAVGLTFGDNSLIDVEKVTFGSETHTYKLVFNDPDLGNFKSLTIDGSPLTAGSTLDVDCSQQLGTVVTFIGSAGKDIFKASGTLSSVVFKNHTFSASDQITGASFFTGMTLGGNYSSQLVLNANSIKNVGGLTLENGFNYNLKTNDGNIAAGTMMTVTAENIGASHTFTFDGSAETNGMFSFRLGTETDVVTGGSKNDTFTITGAIQAGDKLYGHGGNDVVSLNGPLPASLTFGADFLHAIDDVMFDSGAGFKLTTSDGNVAAGGTLVIQDVAILGKFTFDGSAETDGKFSVGSSNGDDNITTGAGNDTIVTTGGNDIVDLRKGGNDTATTGDGDDTIKLGAALTAADKIKGGAGTDTVTLGGNYGAGLTFADTTMVGVEKLLLAAGFDYTLKTASATVANGALLTIKGGGLGTGDVLTFDGSAEANGRFAITGGKAADTLTGGDGDDSIKGGAGADTIKGGKGADILDTSAGADKLVYTSVKQSTGLHHDDLVGFDFKGNDLLDLNVKVTGIDPTRATGKVTTATFDDDLERLLSSSVLHKHHAMFLTPGSGNFAGAYFLVVDANGVAGYQAGADYVFALGGPLNLDKLSVSDFV
jgi:hypothetical protein